MIQTSTRPDFRRKLRLLIKTQKRAKDPVMKAQIAQRVIALQHLRYEEVVAR